MSYQIDMAKEQTNMQNQSCACYGKLKTQFLSFQLVALALGGALAQGTAQGAVVLYDSLSLQSQGGDSLQQYGPMGISFSTGATAFRLEDVEIRLSGLPTSGSVTVDLMSDQARTPKSILLHIGDVGASSGGGAGVIDFNSLSYTLDPGTRYWIAVASTDPSARLGYGNFSGGNGIGLANEYYFDSGGNRVYQNNPPHGLPYQMQLEGTPVVVPETSPALTGGLLCLFGLGYVWRRRCGAQTVR